MTKQFIYVIHLFCVPLLIFVSYKLTFIRSKSSLVGKFRKREVQLDDAVSHLPQLRLSLSLDLKIHFQEENKKPEAYSLIIICI